MGVEVVSCDSGVRTMHKFDAVFICTGQFHHPKVPEMPGLQSFKGRVRHSAAYRNASDLKGRRVVIVGFGNSALDISLEAARGGATSVVVLCRSGTNVLPVADFHGRPADQMLNTRAFTAMPSFLRNLFFFRMVHGTTAGFRRHGMPAPASEKGSMGFANLKEHVVYRQLLEEGAIRILPGSIESLAEHSIRTSAGDAVDADEIILCTGYHLEFPFLAPELQDNLLAGASGRRHLNAYKLIMHPSEPTLCSLGFLLTFGNESAVGEMQARWALALWRGRVRLPTAKELEVDLQKRRKGSKYPQFLPYVAYMDSLAADCGVAPPLSWAAVARSPWLAWKLCVGPVVAAQYRLAGQHSWDQAPSFLRSQPLTALRWADAVWAPPHKAGAKPATPPSRL